MGETSQDAESLLATYVVSLFPSINKLVAIRLIDPD